MRLLIGLLPFLLIAQTSPVVVTGISNIQDYYATHPSSYGSGDTNICTAWTASGTTNYKDTGGTNHAVTGTVFCTVNDGTPIGGSGSNIAIYKITTLDLQNGSNTTVSSVVNNMSSYGGSGAGNAPAGWSGKCNAAGQGSSCTWKSSAFWSYNGNLYLQVERQSASLSWHDSTIIISQDLGVHWCNPYTLSQNSGTCPSNATTAAGDAPLYAPDASYPGSILFPDSGATISGDTFLTSTAYASHLINFQVASDESVSVPAVDGNGTYLYFIGVDGMMKKGYLLRVAKSAVANLTAASYSIYTCTTYYTVGPCDGNQSANWTTTLTNGTSLVNLLGYDNAANAASLSNPLGAPFCGLYLDRSSRYMLTTTYTAKVGDTALIGFPNAPHPWGPWTVGGSNWEVAPKYLVPLAGGATAVAGFTCGMKWTYLNAALESQSVAIAADNYDHSGAATTYFYLASIASGSAGTGTAYAGVSSLKMSMGNEANALPRTGLVWLFDLYDHNGNTNWSSMYANDLVSGRAVMLGVSSASGNGQQSALTNVLLSSNGWQLGQVGYSSRGSSFDLGGSTYNFPLTGSVPFTYFAVFNSSASTSYQSLMGIGANSLDQEAYMAVGQHAAGTLEGGEWASALYGGSVSAGTWYLAFYTFNGGAFNNTNAALYMGSSGVVSKLGVTSVSPGNTLSIGTGPAKIGWSYSGGNSFVGQLGPCGWYNRVLTLPEMNHIYSALKTALARRGVSLY